MKNNKLLILTLITLAVIVAAGITAKLQAPQRSVTKQILFPELANQINDIAKISITGNRQAVLLKKQGEIWVLESADNYPALFNKVRALVINLANLKIEEEKTADPALYARLGVEDPDSKDASSLLITLKTGTNEVAASIIAGKQRQSAGSKPGLYVRFPDQPRALLAEGMLNVSSDSAYWFERNLFDVPSNDIKNVTIQYADGDVFEIYKEQLEQIDFQIRGDPVESSAAKIILTRISRSMEEMHANGVQSLDNFLFPEESITTTVTTFDGLIITAKTVMVDNKAFVHFTFAVDPSASREGSIESTDTVREPAAESRPDLAQEAHRLTETLSQWVYQIPDFKYEALTSNPASLKKPTEISE